MTLIGFPRAVPDELLVTGLSFKLKPIQKLHPLRRGKTIAVDMGPSLWLGDWRSPPLTEDELGEVRGFFDTLASDRPFYGFDQLREWPLAYRHAGFAGLEVGGQPWDGTGELAGVGAESLTVDLEELPEQFVLSPGDYLAWDYHDGSDPVRACHRVSAGATATGAGTLTVEIRPEVQPGWQTGATVHFHRAAAEMLVLPDSYSEEIDRRRLTQVAWQAVQLL